MAMHVHIMWWRLCVTRVRVCAPVYARGRRRVINGLKHQNDASSSRAT